MTPTVSPSGSSVGYSFWEWFLRNKAYVKAVIEILVAVVTYGLELITIPSLNAAMTALVTLGAKVVLDWIDFRYSAVLLTPKT